MVDNEAKSLEFGVSLMDDVTLPPFVQTRDMVHNLVCLPWSKVVLNPEAHECVMFKDFFIAGLWFPIQDIIEEILHAYNIEMHHCHTRFQKAISIRTMYVPGSK